MDIIEQRIREIVREELAAGTKGFIDATPPPHEGNDRTKRLSELEIYVTNAAYIVGGSPHSVSRIIHAIQRFNDGSLGELAVLKDDGLIKIPGIGVVALRITRKAIELYRRGHA